MRRLAVAWLLCVLATDVGAQEAASPTKQPPASSQPQSDGSGHKPATEPKNAAPTEAAEKAQPRADAEPKENEEKREREEKAKLDRRLVELTGDLAEYTKWLAYATVALFAVTAGLFALAALQGRDAKEAGRSARRSAKAANRAAKAAETALVGIDRPHVFIARPVVYLYAQDRCRYPHAEYYIRNFGRTPAIVRNRVYGLLFCRTIPEAPPYDSAVHDADMTVIDAGKEVLGEAAQSDRILEDDEVERARANTLQTLFFGKIEYEDTFGARFEMGFGYIRKPSDGRYASNDILVACEHAGYNYHRKIET